MTTLDEVLARIEALDDDFSFFSSQGEPPEAAAVDALERKLGKPLAPAHRALIERLGACAVVADENVWPRPELYSIAPLWKHHWGFEVFGVSAEAPLDAVRQTKARAPKGLVAALGRSCGSTVGYNAKGKLFEWTSGEEPAALEAKSLFVVLDEWLKTLAEDKVQLAQESPEVTPESPESPEDEWLDKIADLEIYARAVPELMKETPDVRGAVIELVGKRLARDDSQTELMFALGRLTEDARAITALQHHARKGPAREEAIRALGGRRLDAEHVVPTLLACLDDDDDGVIYAAAEKLGNYAAPSMVKPLVAALATVQKKERWEFGVAAGTIYETLAKVGAKATGEELATVVDTLAKNLAPKERYAALHAFESLIALGPKAKAAVPVLEKAVLHDDLYLSSLARHALASITGDWKPHVEALRKAAKSKDSAVREVAKRGVEDSKRSSR
ncbi:MAG: HEAT repeat domain-containing protein [Labilithrix sp.]|nr:HEAT repeat domain-containing protein [Labilithrix sp.]